jgi:hypothetical protein
VIDLRDVIYFVSLAGLFLALAYAALLGRKLAPGAGTRRLRLGVGMLAASLVVVNLLGSYIGGRLDLTPGNAYTLSPATGRLVRDLDDIVTVKLFASQELPTEVALMKRDVDDLLRDLRSAGRGQVRTARWRNRDDPFRPAHRRSRVPARLDHPAAEPRQEAGDRLRIGRPRARGRVPGNAGAAPALL